MADRSAAPPRRLGPSRASLVVRGVLAAGFVLSVSVSLTAYGSGAFDRDPEVYASIPSSAGLLVGDIAVQYQGVQVGTVVAVDDGIDSSRVTIRLGGDSIDRIPATALVRIVPRTLFGDVYLRLVPGAPGPPLAAGDLLTVDSSPDAVHLAGVYRTVDALLQRLDPAATNVALTAIADALRGRGADLGATIDRLVRTSAALEPQARAALDRTDEGARVVAALADATQDVLAAVDAATTLSQTALDHRSGVETLIRAASGTAASAGAVAAENTAGAVTIVRSGAPILQTTAAGSTGLASTLGQFTTFGAAGARIFATGRFDITAVPDFSDPLPYTAADCPRYPGLGGPGCGLLLGPLVRGTEVTIR